MPRRFPGASDLKKRTLVPRLVLALALIVYCGTLITLSCLKHATYHSSLIDLGIFDQVVWNTAQGRFYWDTLDPFVQGNHVFLGQHFSPGIAILAPIYRVAPSVYSLLVVQTLALAAGAIPIYILAARRAADERVAALIALAFLLYPSLAFANLFDFHEIALAAPFLAWAVERLDAGKSKSVVALLFIALLFKEEVGLIVAAFGAFAFIGRRRRALGLLLVTLGIGWTVGVVYVAVPLIRGGAYLFEGRYQGGLLRNGSINFDYLTAFMNAAKASYLAWLLVPLLGLPLLGGWSTLLLVPTIAYTMLSTYPFQYDIHYHYATPLIPLLFASAIYAICRLPQLRLPLAAAMLAAVIVGGEIIGPLPWQSGFSAPSYTMGPREQAMSRLVALVPRNARLAVDNQMGAHLSERPWITHFFTGYETANALLFDLTEDVSPDLSKRLHVIAEIEHDPTWKLVARADDVVLYVRANAPRPPGSAKPKIS